jgi:hypothetical protein
VRITAADCPSGWPSISSKAGTSGRSGYFYPSDFKAPAAAEAAPSLPAPAVPVPSGRPMVAIGIGKRPIRRMVAVRERKHGSQSV